VIQQHRSLPAETRSLVPPEFSPQSLLDTFLADRDEAVVCLDLEGSIQLWNPAAEWLYGFAKKEVLGEHIRAILPLYETPVVEQLLQNPQLIDGRQTETVERDNKSGGRISVSLRRSLLRDKEGVVIGILERSCALNCSTAISRAERQLRLLVDQIPVIFWSTDHRLLITSRGGQGFLRPSGAAGKSTGQTLNEFFRCPPGETAPVQHHLDALQGNSSRFEYKRRNHIYDISLEPHRNEAGVIIGCLGVAVDITERKKTEEEIRYRANHDGLTGLVNYREFIDNLQREIQRAQRSPHSFGLLLLDMNGLKGINDRLGHLAGNRALKNLARVMQETCRASDVAARYGGDEFAVILLDADGDRTEQVAKRIDNYLRQQCTNPPLSVSIGAAVFPQDGASANELLETADKRLYQDKKSGRDQQLRPMVTFG